MIFRAVVWLTKKVIWAVIRGQARVTAIRGRQLITLGHDCALRTRRNGRWVFSANHKKHLFPHLVVNFWRDACLMGNHFRLLASDVGLLLCTLLWLDNTLVKIWLLRVAHTTHRNCRDFIGLSIIFLEDIPCRAKKRRLTTTKISKKKIN